MNDIEAYLYLFSDSIFSNLILNSNGEFVIDVMNIFGSYNYYFIIILAVSGSFIATILNMFLGRMLLKVKKAEKIVKDSNNYNYIYQTINFALPFLLFSCTFPTIGAIIATSIGIFKIELKYYHFFYILAARILYYNYKIMI